MPSLELSLPSRRPTRRRAAAPMLLTALMVAMAGAQAQTWTGQGISNNWSDPLNWQGLQLPSPGNNTSITFAGTRRLAPLQNISPVFSLNALTFASGAGAFDLGGSALRFVGTDARVGHNSVNAVQIRNAIEIAGTLSYLGNGSATFAGSLSRSVGTARADAVLVKQGAGTLALAAANSFDGSVVLEGGQVLLRNSLALQSASVVLNVANGLSLGSLTEASLGNLSGAGALALGATHLTLNPADTTANLYSGALTSSSGGRITKAGSGTTRLSGVSQFDRLQVSAGRLQLEGGSLQLGNTSEGLTVTGGTLDLSGAAVLTTLATTTQVDGGAAPLLRVAGAGSQLKSGFQLLVGNHAQGELVVETGGSVEAATYLAMGFSNGSVGSFVVGAGGRATSAYGLLGTLTGGTGTAVVQGLDARWTTGGFGIGGFNSDLRGGTGQLTVREGGRVLVSNLLDFWSANANVTVDGGTLEVGGLSSTTSFGSVVLQSDPGAGLGLDGAPALKLTGGGNSSFAGSLSGAGSLLKTGGGTQTLAGPGNGFTGVTTLQGGRLVLAHQDALRGSGVRIELNDALDLNGLPQVVLGSLAGTGKLAVGNTQLTLGEDGRSAVYAGVLGGGGTLVKKGTGVQTLTGVGSTLNNVVVEGGGKLVLSGGSLSLASGNSDGSAALLLNTGGRMEVLNGGRVQATALGRSSLFVDGDAVSELLVAGAGSRVEVGFQAVIGNSALGRARVRDGGVLTSNLFLGAGFGPGSQGLIDIDSGGQAQGALVTLGTLAGGQGQMRVSGAGSQLLATFELGLGGVTDAQNGGTGLLQLLNGGSAMAPTTRFWTAGSRIEVDGGSLATGGLLGDAGQVQLMSDPLAGAALTLNGTAGHYSFSGAIGGEGSLLKQGGSTQSLLGANSFAGSVRVEQGQLIMASGAAFEYQVSPGARLQLGERSLGGAVVNAQLGGSVSYTHSTLSGGLLMGGGMHDIGAVRRVVGTQLLNGSALTPAAGASFVGVVNHGLIDNLPGQAFSWNGGSNATGTLRVAGSTQLSGFSSGGLIEVLPAGVLANSGSDLVLGGGSRTLVGSAEQAGGRIELQGGTRLQLNGGLLVNNGSIDGTVAVNFGGLAKGAGSFGSVVVGDGGRFSPGNSPGRVHSSAATWGAGGSLLVELSAASGSAGVNWDLWAIDGGLDIAAGSTVNSRFTVQLATLDGANQAGLLAGFDASRAWQWQIVDTGSGISGFSAGSVFLDTQGFQNALGGGRLSLAVQDGDLYLVFAPVPEPQTWALLGFGLAGLAWRARRVRSASLRAGSTP